MKKPKVAKPKKPREKPLSLHGISFDDAVQRIARAKPPKAAKKVK